MESIKKTPEILYENIKQTFNENSFSKIKLLKLITAYIVNTQCAFNPNLCNITSEIKDAIVNSLIMAYIELWLDNDEPNKQSIDSYVKNIFQMQSQIKSSSEDVTTPKQDLYDVIRREMYNGESLMNANIYLQEQYSRQQNYIYNNTPSKQRYGNKYSLLELESFYKAGVEPLYIYKDIFKNKQPYKTSNRNSTSREIDIAEQDIEDYKKYLNHIKSLINETDSSEKCDIKATKNNKEFVVKCLFVWKQERTYRYRFTAMLAKYLSDNSNSINPIYIPDAIKHYHNMYPDFSNRDKINCRLSYFIKNYDELIRYGYSNMNNSDISEVVLARVCFDISFTLLCQTFLSKTLLGSWNDNDFEDVARFMIYEYGIKECLEMPDMKVLTPNSESPYTIIRKLFQLPEYINTNQISYYKEHLQTAKKSVKSNTNRHTE